METEKKNFVESCMVLFVTECERPLSTPSGTMYYW